MELTVLPLLAKRMETEFDVFEELENTLEKNKIPVTIRKSRGKDIDAACGQLANKLK